MSGRGFPPAGPAVGLALALALGLASCGPSYSPNTYSANAVQQANKVEQGVVVGVRRVGVSAQGVVGATTGAAAGGIAGAQVPGGAAATAFGALGGAVVGGVVGTTIEHASGDTFAYEYIVRKANGDLMSVTQRDAVPLALGQSVLLITGNQARIVPDYTVKIGDTAKAAESKPAESKPAEKKPEEATQAATHLQGAPTQEAPASPPPAPLATPAPAAAQPAPAP